MPGKLKEKVRVLKSELSILTVAYKDKRTPVLAKLLLGLTIGYMLSPIDLIPDFIPILGLLDDLIIVPLLIKLSISLIPKEIIEDAKKQILATTPQRKKSNWIGAVIIIAIWIVALYQISKWIKLI